jgi:hypothetical protein
MKATDALLSASTPNRRYDAPPGSRLRLITRPEVRVTEAMG